MAENKEEEKEKENKKKKGPFYEETSRRVKMWQGSSSILLPLIA